jgi:hypothetical protein
LAPGKSTHVPPFWQAVLPGQSLITMSHFAPEYPGRHEHVYPGAVSVSMHCDPFMHGPVMHSFTPTIVQVELPGALISPLGHALQDMEPGPEKVFAGHALQLVAPSTPKNEPAAHASQDAFPAVALNVPGKQGIAKSVPPGANDPAGACTQVEPFKYEPAGQTIGPLQNWPVYPGAQVQVPTDETMP